jgi:hypothetical protein
LVPILLIEISKEMIFIHNQAFLKAAFRMTSLISSSMNSVW